MNRLAMRYGCYDTKTKKAAPRSSGDLFVASIINQKAVNQNAQQVLVAVAAQVLNVVEAQFGFATNEDNDEINV